MKGFTVDIQADMSLSSEIEMLVETAVSTTLQQQNVTPPVSLTLVLSDDDQIQQLNRDFRGVDAPTDVLSFPSGDVMPGMEALGVYLGDIMISMPYAQKQAVQSGHAFAAELQLLAVHGVLHLLGHDHLEPDEKAHMWQAQTAVLDQLNLGGIIPTETPHA